MRLTKDKENAVEQARRELEAKQRKSDEDKAQTDPSDPESTTSSLTVSSRSAVSDGIGGLKTISADKEASSTGDKKRSASVQIDTECAKKPRLSSHESSISSTTSSGGDDSGKRPSDTKSTCQTTSSMSDLTDSNKESSSNSENSLSRSRLRHRSTDDQASGGSVTSDAAVAESKENHPEVLIKRRKAEHTSLENDFELDYEEVFVKSNVPQVLATSAGRIIACKCRA